MNLCTRYLSLKTDQEGVALLEIKRAEKRNALHEVLIRELTHLFQEIQRSREIRVLILTGEGEAFCSGVDLVDMQKAGQLSEEDNQKKAIKLARLMQVFYQLNKPTIAAINGSAYGAGVGLIACSDIAIASAKDSVFCFSEIQFNLTPAIISPYVIAALGQRLAQYYFLSSETCNIEEAHALSLIHLVVPKVRLMRRAQEIGMQLARHDAEALREIKHIIRQYHPIGEDLIADCAHRLATRRMKHSVQQALTQFIQSKK